MNKESILYTIAGVLFIFVMFILLKPEVRVEEPQAAVTETPATKDAVTYTSPHTGESLSVTFSDDSAVLHSNSFTDVEMAQVEAASGARYENAEQGVSLWNVGAEVSVYQDDVVTFQGQTESSMGKPNPGGIEVRTAALTSNAWLWQKTQMNDGTLITPKKVDAFSLTFESSGRVSGTTDCNGFGGSYSVDNDVLTMGEFMMTMMYCDGSQEMEFQQMVSKPVTFMFTDAGELVLMLPYDSGSVIFTPIF